jgi:hypothetical protein
MTQADAEALTPGQKIQYLDGRIATVTVGAVTPPPVPPPLTDVFPSGVPYVSIVFDADPEPKPVCQIKVHDFVKAEAI